VGPDGSKDHFCGTFGEVNKDGSWMVRRGMTKYPLLPLEILNNGEFAVDVSLGQMQPSLSEPEDLLQGLFAWE
jgi:hypothetical protein